MHMQTLSAKKIHLGYYGTELAAAKAYDNWTKDFSDMPLNFIERTSNEISNEQIRARTVSIPAIVEKSTAKSFLSLNDVGFNKNSVDLTGVIYFQGAYFIQLKSFKSSNSF